MMQIGRDDARHRLDIDNPWWTDGQGVDDHIVRLPRRRYFPRFLKVVRSRDVPRAVVLMGPRRVGKTVMIRQTIDALLRSGVPGGDILFATLDHPLFTGLGIEAVLDLWVPLARLRDGRLRWVFLDEVQYLDDWPRHLKAAVDAFPSVRFVVSGSAAAALRRQSLESGAGRFTDVTLPPLAFCEFLVLAGREDAVIDEPASPTPKARDVAALNRAFLDYIAYGGFPEMVTNPAVREDPARYFRGDILDKVLQRDLPSLYGVDDTRDLGRLFATIAFTTGQEINIDRLATDAGLAKNTLKKYLGYLEAAFLVFRLPRIDQAGRRFRRETFFKLHLADPSLRSALFGAPNEGDRALGSVVETAVVAQYRHGPVESPIAYARWDRGEADLVVMNGLDRPARALEVKWSDRPADRLKEIAPFLDFCRRHDLSIGRATLTSRTRSARVDADGIDLAIVPAALEAYRTGRDAIDLTLDMDRSLQD